MIYTSILTFSLLLFSSCAVSQTDNTPRSVGGPCEGCEAVLELKGRELRSTDTLPGFFAEGQQIMVHGVVYDTDGTTPAPGVILYIYHTDKEGFYTPDAGATGWARKHGYIRGWVKTDEHGRYAFYTTRPAPYPDRSGPAHIHYTVLEPNGKYYWLGSAHFKDDPLLTQDHRDPIDPRGASDGLLQMKEHGNLLIGRRDIVLGSNVEGYDQK